MLVYVLVACCEWARTVYKVREDENAVMVGPTDMVDVSNLFQVGGFRETEP